MSVDFIDRYSEYDQLYLFSHSYVPTIKQKFTCILYFKNNIWDIKIIKLIENMIENKMSQLALKRGKQAKWPCLLFSLSLQIYIFTYFLLRSDNLGEVDAFRVWKVIQLKRFFIADPGLGVKMRFSLKSIQLVQQTYWLRWVYYHQWEYLMKSMDNPLSSFCSRRELHFQSLYITTPGFIECYFLSLTELLWWWSFSLDYFMHF